MRLAHRLGDLRLSSQWGHRASQIATRAGAKHVAALEIERAKLARSAGRIMACRHHVAQALRANPLAPSILEEAADIMQQWGDLPRAIACLSQFNASDPSVTPNLNLLLRRAVLAVTSGQTDEALGLAEQLFTNPRTSASMLVATGKVFLSLLDTTAAEHCFLEALARDPHESSAHVALARVQLHRGQTRTAEAHAERAITLAPNDHHARVVRALVRLDQPSFSQVDLETFDAAVEAFPKDAEIRGVRAQARRRLGHARAALEDLIAAKHTGNEAQNFLFDLEIVAIGRQLNGSGNIEEMTAWVRSGQTSFPSDVARKTWLQRAANVCQSQLGALLWKLPDAGRLALANRLHDRFLWEEGELASPQSLDLRLVAMLCPDELLRATCGNRSTQPTYVDPRSDQLLPLRLRRSSRHVSKATQWLLTSMTADEVLQSFAAILREYPRSHHPYAYRGEVLLWLGRFEEAAGDFAQGLAINAQARWIHIGLGAVHTLNGQFDEAMRSFQRSVDVAPQFVGPTLYAYRGEALRRSGQTREALRDLQVACRDNPSRIGGWVNLWLAADDAGDEGQRNAAMDELRTRALFLLADGAEESLSRSIYEIEDRLDQRRLLEYVLNMMRGNRSSSCVTYFTRTNELRVAHV